MISELLHLRAGRLRCIYDNGVLRSIRWNEREIVRRVYMALRDRFWNTVPFTIKDFSLQNDVDSFKLSFAGIHRTAELHFQWGCSIIGSAEGEIVLSMQGHAGCTFMRNRIGWCVLHPLDVCRGASCTLEHSDGSLETSLFPGKAIEPHQPFVDLRAMRYTVAQGVECELRFSGDIFETEDQRNWTDATFKTYSTPQSLPVPVEVREGTMVEQQVRIAVSGDASGTSSSGAVMGVDIWKLFNRAETVPAIGLRLLPGPLPVEKVADLLRAVGVAHLRREIHSADAGVLQELPVFLRLAGTIGGSAELAVYCTDAFSRELQLLAEALKHAGQVPVRILLFAAGAVVTPAEVAAEARRVFTDTFPRVTIVAGTDRYFVEINRVRAPADTVDGICFSANPQVHTFDDRAVMENTEGLMECIRTAGERYPDTTIVLSPLTMRPRKDPARPQKDGGEDARQKELFGAAWLTAAIGACVEGGLDVLTVLAATGPEGIMDAAGEVVFPVYHVLTSGICRASSAASVRLASGDSLVSVVAFTTEEYRAVLVANCTSESATVTLRNIPQNAVISVLDGSNVCRARTDPDFWKHECKAGATELPGEIRLEPYSVARIEMTLY